MDEYLEEIDYISSERQLAILKAQKKPKFKISRVPEELRMVPVVLDIEYDKYVLRDQFQWNLNDQQISPSEFVQKMVDRIGFGNVKTMQRQLIFQIMEYIEKHSFHHPMDLPQALPTAAQRKVASEKKKQQGHRQSRQSTSKLTRLSFGINKKCNNCEHINIQSGQYCKKCKLPYSVVDNINCQEPLTKACLLFYEIIQRKTYGSIEARNLIKEDFSSLYQLKNKLLEQCDEEEMIEELFQEFMINKDNLEEIEKVYAKPTKGRPRKLNKLGRIKKIHQEVEEEQEEQEMEIEEENEDKKEERKNPQKPKQKKNLTKQQDSSNEQNEEEDNEDEGNDEDNEDEGNDEGNDEDNEEDEDGDEDGDGQDDDGDGQDEDGDGQEEDEEQDAEDEIEESEKDDSVKVSKRKLKGKKQQKQQIQIKTRQMQLRRSIRKRK